MDMAGSFGTHRRNQQSNAGTNIRRNHIGTTQFETIAQPDHSRPVRIAKNDLRSHVDQFVDKEETAFEHLLMDQHTADSLRRHNEEDTQQVRRQSRPGSIGNRHNGAVDKRLDLIRIVCRDMDIVTDLFDRNSQTAE